MSKEEKVNLFLLRRKKKLTLEYLSKEMKCSISLISMWETGTANMSKSKVNLYRDIIVNK